MAKRIVAQVENKELVEKRHDQLFEAVVDLFSKYGYVKTSMRDISKASGINLSYIYRYVASKNDILYLFYERLFKLYSGAYKSIELDQQSDPVEQLKNLISSVLHIAHDKQKEILTMYTESRHLDEDSLRSVLEKESSMIDALRSLIERGVKQGRFTTRDPFMAANFIQYLLVIEPMRGWSFRKERSLESFIQSTTEFILNALGTRDGQG
ncbi:MAG: hypothetical protein Kow0092_16110 [Deferrisomatales bacterium]